MDWPQLLFLTLVCTKIQGKGCCCCSTTPTPYRKITQQQATRQHQLYFIDNNFQNGFIKYINIKRYLFFFSSFIFLILSTLFRHNILCLIHKYTFLFVANITLLLRVFFVIIFYKRKIQL
ncbi:hypothetical protein FF38_08418 [Lucilia cuprina]|uniref:Transmembrane protein n=1 Tax=Lucilia cuprina TaxID=7375 RepID=A0A0L0BMD7_LUCCU|nr:hypothetical protein FF38_08418 [Lucilia cuprina]